MSSPIKEDALLTDKIFSEMVEHVRSTGGDSSDLMALVGMIATYFVTNCTRDKKRGAEDLIQMIRTNVAYYLENLDEGEGLAQ